MNWNLKGKKALITGGTKGIGEATVEEFSKLGAEVLFTARNSEAIKSYENKLKNNGFKATGIAMDVTDSTGVNNLTDWVAKNWGSLDILVNNAGMNIRKLSHEFTSEEYDQIIKTNTTAPFVMANAFLPLLRASKKASIVNVASVAGLFDVQTGSPYGISKAGLIQLTRNLAVEWAKYGIRVNAISPWFTETPLTENLLKNKEKIEHVIERTPLARIAKAQEMAAVIAFLSMETSSFVTGQNIIVDGGMSVNAL